ncbi:MAG: hypothetical protein J7J51_03955 [Candidatus Omnitrophica bacterium]|nr:hypothetical protein [Candidatus Omnitrophota bacterium]
MNSKIKILIGVLVAEPEVKDMNEHQIKEVKPLRNKMQTASVISTG